jgi:hypothetical protein
MVTIEIRFANDLVKVRQFGSGEFRRWTVLRPGDIDRLTGWTCEELQHLGEGLWGFPETTGANLRSTAMAGA